MPNDGFLPQISQTDAMMNLLLVSQRPGAGLIKPKVHCSIANDDLSLDADGW